jgi:putative MATE family efflux protein
VKKIIGVMFTFLSMMAVTATILGFFLNDWLLNIMNVPEEAYVQAKEYSTVCYMGMIFIFGYNIVSAILRGMGDSKRPFIIIAVATSLNLIFDLVLVAGLGMGPKGAAIATVSGQGLSFIGSIIYLYVKKDQFGFDFKLNSFKMDFKVLKALVRLGVPLALQHSAIVISKLFVNSSINFYGVTAAAVNGVGARIRQISFVVCNALGMASTSMIGQNFGAGKKKRIVKVIYVSMGIGLVFAAILSVAILMFPEQIFSVFNNDPEVLEMSHVYSIIAMLGFVASALRSPMMGLINGLGNTKLSMLLGLLDGVIARVGLAVLLGTTLGMGIKGYWYGDALAGFIPFIIGGVYFWSGMWKKRRLAMA